MTKPHCIIGFLGSDSLHREGIHRLPFEKLEPAVSTLTHILYGPAYLSTSNQLVPAHPLDIDSENREGTYRKVTSLKKLNPHLKVLLSVGRRDYDETRTTHYVDFLADAKARSAFIDDALSVVKKYGFDGIDLAWEFPRYKKNPLMHFISCVWGGENIVKTNFATFVKEVKAKFGDLIVTVTALPNQKYIEDFYDVPVIQQLVQFIIVSTYDYCTPKDNPLSADFSAPLFTPKNRKQSVDVSVTKWRATGAQDNKLVIGVPTFGRSWVLGDNMLTFKSVKVENQEPPFNATGPTPPGVRTGVEGQVALVGARERLPNPQNSHHTGANAPLQEFTKFVHENGAYAINTNIIGGDFISYEVPEAATSKAKYVQQKGLAGIALFNLEFDDYNGEKYVVKFPLLNAVSKQFRL